MMPYDATILPNENIIIASRQGVVELDDQGKQVNKLKNASLASGVSSF